MRMKIILSAVVAFWVCEAADTNRQKAEKLWRQSLERAEAGDFRSALPLINSSVEADPTFAEAHFARGVVLQGLWSNSEALTAYQKAIRLKPDYAAAHIRSAQL